MGKIIFLLALAAAGFNFAAAGPEDHFSHLPQGGRRSLHGMVLFGAGPYFLEHIPMLTPPHDFQVIAQVRLKDVSGAPVSRDFSSEGFTFKPSANFSLNDYVAGRLKNFSGSIHQGSFEQGGEMIPGLSRVNVEVIEYKLIRQLPAASTQSDLQLTDGTSTFALNIIRPEKSLQIIRNVTKDVRLWCVTEPDFIEPCP